jgi:KipI family sensor histidine kinase inhibitor
MNEPSSPARPEGAHDRPIIRFAGDSALLVEFGNALDPEINNAAIAFNARLKSAHPAHVVETAATNRSVLVSFDALARDPDDLRREITDILVEQDWFAAPPPAGRKLWRLPVAYGGVHGPDLAALADLMGMGEAAVAEAHAASRQRVFMVGFAPGHLYTGLLPEAFDLPRLSDIKPSVPPGSISVAIRQSVVCSTTIPTGWRTVGRTPFRTFDLRRDPVFMIEAGDEIAFEPVSDADYRRFDAVVGEGRLPFGPEVLE